MRRTREDLLAAFPSWNENKHDIVKVNYGDEPLVRWDRERYNEWFALTSALSNVEALDVCVYAQNGDYSKYNTLAGEVYIKEDGTVLAGSVNVRVKRRTYNIILNNMYGTNSLDILGIGQDVVGFSNSHGQGSPSRNVKEMEKETIEIVLNCPLEDFGIGIQKFMESAREVYSTDTTNHIIEKALKVA